MKTRTLFAAAALSAVSATPVLAQDRLLTRDRPDAAPVSAPAGEAPPLPSAAPTTPEVPPFVLRAVSVQGASVPADPLNRALAPFIGQTLDADGLARLQAALAQAYADHGLAALPLVQLDTRRAAEGVVVIYITEARIARVLLTGDVGGEMDVVRRNADLLTQEAPLSRATADRRLFLIGDVPGLKTTTALRPSDQPGAVDLVLDLKRTPWETTFTADSRGSRTLGRTQLGVQIDRNGLYRLGDRTRLAVTVPGDFESFVHVAASHRMPVGWDGAAVDFSVGHLRTRPEGGVEGDATTAAITASWPMIRGPRENLYLSIGLDGLNSSNAVFGERLADESTRTVRASAAWSRLRPTWSASAGLVLSQGVDGLGAETPAPDLTDLDFLKLNVSVEGVRLIGRQVRLRASAAAQLTEDATPTSEQFAIGGEVYGRGFPAALLAGDSGWGVALEAAWIPTFTPRFFKGSELFVFGDGGEVTLNARPGIPELVGELASAGVGVRIAFSDRAVLELEIARALEDPRTDDGDWRGGFALTARF
ncbi:MAG TPA: ShlB/FhaC/HecB family hemolysin secretion/activation protein [Brevundimonas sp.]|jgi:hemolysin activation/secretion protein|uniref:ShlB/FhaC/HecB family hemolysin secretion/activation protein n=1 Tax=Brevundimonas sp. TaxID=1871086 RepID=UPI002DEA8BD1|nr:ShlB/FhaC/HecB family hemolysin secretion/activation protein [Brevundimonas sp.]